MKVSMLTTKDNPYDPFDDFDNWFMYDIEKGYNTCGLLARIVRQSDSLSVEENEFESVKAMDWIIQHDVTGQFEIVSREIDDPLELYGFDTDKSLDEIDKELGEGLGIVAA